MKYTIQNPMILNGEIVGYELLDANSRVRRTKLEDVIKLAESGMTNCRVVQDEKGDKHLMFNKDDENTVGSTDKTNYTIECRIIQDGSLAGYKCKTEDGESKRLRPSKVWELAAMGLVTNAEATIVNNTITLIGKDKHLRELTVLKL